MGAPSTTTKGQRAEQLAASFLIQQGYRILERNYRCRGGEIDLVAEEGEVLCFVEVRSRRSSAYGEPLETIGGRKRGRLIHAARHYLTVRACPGRDVRFDAVGIIHEPELSIELVRGAFEAGSY